MDKFARYQSCLHIIWIVKSSKMTCWFSMATGQLAIAGHMRYTLNYALSNDWCGFHCTFAKLTCSTNWHVWNVLTALVHFVVLQVRTSQNHCETKSANRSCWTIRNLKIWTPACGQRRQRRQQWRQPWWQQQQPQPQPLPIAAENRNNRGGNRTHPAQQIVLKIPDGQTKQTHSCKIHILCPWVPVRKRPGLFPWFPPQKTENVRGTICALGWRMHRILVLKIFCLFSSCPFFSCNFIAYHINIYM